MSLKDPIKRNDYHREWCRKNPDKVRDKKLKSRYGITSEMYNWMLGAQDGVCAICGGNCRKNKNLSVDHDHRRQNVRQLLCDDCNNLLGRARENPEILRKAAAYIEFWNSVLM